MKPRQSDPEIRAAQGDARRSRIALTLACALVTVTLFVTLAIWQARLEIAERRMDVAHDVISTVEAMIERVSSEHSRIMPFVGQPCDIARLHLAASDAFIP